MSVICPQIEERGDKEKALRHHSFSWKHFYALVCVCTDVWVCVISSSVLQPSCLAVGLLDTRSPSPPPPPPTPLLLLPATPTFPKTSIQLQMCGSVVWTGTTMDKTHTGTDVSTHTHAHTDGYMMEIHTERDNHAHNSTHTHSRGTHAVSSLSLLQSRLLALYGLSTPTIC